MEIVPHVGIGTIRLGMPQEEVGQLRGSGLQVDYAGTPAVVTFIQGDDGTGAEYRGVDLFGDPADEVVAAVARLEGLDPLDYPPGKHSYLFPALNLLLWRGEVADEPGEQGYTFQAASIHVPGYHQGAALEQILRETTHRGEPGEAADRRA